MLIAKVRASNKMNSCRWILHYARVNGLFCLTKWYRTPQILHRIYPQVSDTCWRCGNHTGDLMHIFWTCPKIIPFWTQIHATMQKFTGLVLDFKPALYLPHHILMALKKYRKSIVRHLINAARAFILLLWKSPEPPAIKQWLMRVADSKVMENFSLLKKELTKSFHKQWFNWAEFAD